MHLIRLLGTATKLWSRTSGQVVSTQQTELSSGSSFYANRREGTSALHTVYASFYKQWSHMSHAKEQARYTLYIHCSLNKGPT